MGDGFDFSDDFFNDETQEDVTDVAAEIIPEMLDMPEIFPEDSKGMELLLLYDDGGLKDNLRRCISQTDYCIIEACDLAGAREVLMDHPNLGMIVSNSTVAGDDAASILRSLVAVNPDVICIICTDMVDLLAFSALINTAPVYKILTFPLDIDKELIPALGEMASVSMVRQFNRSEWNNLVKGNEDYAAQLRDALHFNRIRQGVVRKMYNGMAEVLAKASEERCNDPFGNTVKTVKVFQKKILDRFFLSLSSNPTSLDRHIRALSDAFNNEEEGRIVRIECDRELEGNQPLCSRVFFIVWLLIYRLSLSGRSYSGSANIEVKGSVMAFIDVKYDIDSEKWEDIHKNNLQKSYTSVVEGIADSFSSGFEVRAAKTARVYETSVSVEPDV